MHFFSKIIRNILGAAFSWWLVTILIWGFSIIFEWNISTVEKNGNYIHIFAWSPPAILTLLAAHNEKVKTQVQLQFNSRRLFSSFFCHFIHVSLTFFL